MKNRRNFKCTLYYSIFRESTQALKKIFPLINLNEIFRLIDDVDMISDIHRLYYKTMIKNIYEKILEYSYNKLMNKKL